MTQPKAPGIYVEEFSAPSQRIEGVPTATAGMVGVTKRGPKRPALITSFTQFVNEFGGGLSEPPSALRDKWALDPHDVGQWWQFDIAVKGFFDNVGQRLFLKRFHPCNRRTPSSKPLFHAF